MEHELKIGELASAVDVSRNIIIICEQHDLLPCAGRTRGGYRLYREEDIERLRFIRQAQALGFSIDEIRELLPEPGAGLAGRRRMRDRLNSTLEEMDARFAEMRYFRRTLIAYLKECEETLTGKRGNTCRDRRSLFTTRARQTSRPFGARSTPPATRRERSKEWVMDNHSVGIGTNRSADEHARCALGGQGTQGQSRLGRALVAIGLGGAAIAALCCVAPFLLAGLLAAIGLGFILNDAILMGLLVVFVGVAALGFYLLRRTKHA